MGQSALRSGAVERTRWIQTIVGSNPAFHLIVFVEVTYLIFLNWLPDITLPPPGVVRAPPPVTPPGEVGAPR